MRKNVKEERKQESKARIPSNKTVYGEIEYKSELEAYAARMLTDNKIEFGYEVATFTVMPSFICTVQTYEQLRKKTATKPVKFDIRKGKVDAITYTPDFVHINSDKTGWVMEVKGIPNESFPLRFKLFKKYLVENGYTLTLFVPRSKAQIVQCVEIIKTLNSTKKQ